MSARLPQPTKLAPGLPGELAWMTIGDAVIKRSSERLLVQLAQGIDKGEVPDGMVVRVSSPSPEPAPAYRSQLAFLDDLLPTLPARDAQRLTGR